MIAPDAETRGPLRSLDHVYYWVGDMNRAVDFYRDTLGMSLVRREERWVEFDVGGRRFALHATDGREVAPGGAVAVFEVDDLDAAGALLRQRGVPVEHVGDVKGYARFASLRDPDGNAVQLIEYEAVG